jgi:hypothetical protein
MADDTRSSSKRSGGGSSTKKTTAKKTSKKGASSKRASSSSTSKSSTSKRAPSAEPSRRPSGAKIAGEAVRQLSELTNRQVEGVTALHRNDDGWQVELEVLELQRIPTTTDVLATYEVSLDSSGEMEGYRRIRRYVRGQAEGQS